MYIKKILKLHIAPNCNCNWKKRILKRNHEKNAVSASLTSFNFALEGQRTGHDMLLVTLKIESVVLG